MFGFEDMEVESENLFEKFNKYDSWTKEDWEAIMKKEQDKETDQQQQLEDGLLAYLEQDKHS